jgi:endonuclease/exonuclease/phosphatase family metal-dependent hydrolase
MKVLSYNTLFGGFDGAKRERFEAQLQLIRELAPDVLLLQEARGFEANGYAVLLETEQRLAMRGFSAWRRTPVRTPRSSSRRRCARSLWWPTTNTSITPV